MKKHRFLFSSFFQKPAKEVFAWHLRKGALERMLPPWEKVKIIKKEGNVPRNGSRVFLEQHIGPFRKKWIIEHRDFIEGQEFSDFQIKGPFTTFVHRHYIERIDATSCKLEDEVIFSLPFPGVSKYVIRELHAHFRFRHERLQKDLQVYGAYPQKPVKVLLSGSSGMIGRELLTFLRLGGHEVTCLVRSSKKEGQGAIYWDPESDQADLSKWEGFDVVIHLAGENIASGYWTEAKKQKIVLSRTRNTWLLSKMLSRLSSPPKMFICASAIGFYGNRPGEVLDEHSSQGIGFLSEVAAKWEEVAATLKEVGVRVVHTRFGLVLHPSKGIFSRLQMTAKVCLGAVLGTGTQKVSWISIDDLIYGIYHVIYKEEVSGPVNFTSPYSVSQREFIEKIANKNHRKVFLTISKRLLKLFLGQMADELLLTDQEVYPKKLIQSGYEFFHPKLDDFVNFFGRK